MTKFSIKGHRFAIDGDTQKATLYAIHTAQRKDGKKQVFYDQYLTWLVADGLITDAIEQCLRYAAQCARATVEEARRAYDAGKEATK